MEDKYYTPEIEEFHVGFEYEIEDIHDNLVDTTWRKQTYGFADTARGIQEIGLKSMRVKHLDQEDIKSLGWVDGEKFAMSCFIYNHRDKNNEFQMYLHDNLEDGFWFIQIYNWNSEFVFQGNIKNKSELKKLMKMLDI